MRPLSHFKAALIYVYAEQGCLTETAPCDSIILVLIVFIVWIANSSSSVIISLTGGFYCIHFLSQIVYLV